MNRFVTKLLLVTALAGWSLEGQDSSTFIDEARQSYRDVKDKILKSAEWMPESRYNFRPTSSSQTFGQLIASIVQSQFEACSAVAGNGFQGNGPTVESKAELLLELKKSNSTCDSAYASLNSFSANQEVGIGNMRHSRLGLMFLNNAHDNEVYGHLAVYLRLNGILPPSDQARVIPID